MSAYWREQAACRTADAALFDDQLDLSGELAIHRWQRHEKAKTICDRCPVADHCLEDAIANRDTGIRAGILVISGHPFGQSRRPREPRALKPCGTYAAYRRHENRREQPCRPCMDAYAAYIRTRRTRASRRRAA